MQVTAHIACENCYPPDMDEKAVTMERFSTCETHDAIQWCYTCPSCGSSVIVDITMEA